MRERIALAGVEASIGPVVMGLFFLLGVLAVVGVGVGLATAQFHFDPGALACYVGGVIVVILWGRVIVRDLRAVRVVTVNDDGSWKLTGPLGIPRGTIAADVGRTVSLQSRDATILSGPVRRYTQVWGVIEAADGRRWITSRGPASTAQRNLDKLRALGR